MSTASDRFWEAHKDAGRPIPPFSDDDVVDFMVMEALAVKRREAKREAQEKHERAQKRKSHRNLRGMKAGQPAPGAGNG